jgi:hypothetical protein
VPARNPYQTPQERKIYRTFAQARHRGPCHVLRMHSADPPHALAPRSRLRMTRAGIARVSIQLSLLLTMLAIGGSLYEHLVVDTAWLDHPALIQPAQQGIDRKLFWIPIHAALSTALLAALIATWTFAHVRRAIWLALAAYALMRIWSGLYFIPFALELEATRTLTPELLAQARTWIVLSLLRLPLLIASFIALAAAEKALRSAAEAK